MLPLVSVIMPVHNGEKYIKNSILSVLAQTHKNLELIIIDTCSTDSTEELIKTIEDKRIIYIKTEKNIGLTSAFYIGFKASSGEYISRQDPDDESNVNRLTEQLQYLIDNPDYGMVSCLIKTITDDERYRNACVFIDRLQNHYKDSDSIEKAILSDFIPVIFPTLLIKRALMEKVIQSESSTAFDDQIYLFIELLKITRINKLPKTLYYYRRHRKAYHIINERDFNEHCKKILIESSIKKYLLYRDYFQVSKTCTVNLNFNSPIKVLMLVDALNFGGTETHVLALCKELIKKGIYVVVASSGGPLEGMFEKAGIKVYKVPLYTDYVSNKRLYSCMKTLHDIIENEQINLIHAHLFSSMLMANELKRTYKIPFISTIHGLFYPNDILLYTFNNCSAFICVSPPVEKMLLTKLGSEIKNKTYLIPNGIDVDYYCENQKCDDIKKELNIPKDAEIISYCSRLAWSKSSAAEHFIFAFHKLSQNHKNTHAIVIGDGEGRDAIEKEANFLNKCCGKKLIHVVGAKYNVIDFFLSSSIVIGTGRVALEALSCQKPVIAVGNTGYSGIVNKASKNLQWDTYFGDHKALKKHDLIDIYEDMQFLSSNKPEAENYGVWGRQWCCQDFNINNTAEQTIAIYSNALQL